MAWSKRAPRKASPIPVYRGSADEAAAERIAQRARELAPTFGYCTSCGVTVNEAAGKKHDWDCPDVPVERRAARDLIEASSLGTPEAQAIRASAPQDAVEACLRRADELDAADAKGRRG